jgi:phosphoribosylformylglycinamidine synthase subunit PurSL
MGGSHFALVRGIAGGTIPKVRTDEAGAAMDGVHRAIQKGVVRACHDASEGGLAVALAEMAFAGGLGIEADLVHAPYEEAADADGVRDEALLFSESPSRFVCEVRQEDVAAFTEALRGVPHAAIGRVTGSKALVLRGVRELEVVNELLESLREAFLRPLRDGGPR